MFHDRLLRGAAAVAVFLGFSAWANDGAASNSYVTLVPNGQCGSCHTPLNVEVPSAANVNVFGRAWGERCRVFRKPVLVPLAWNGDTNGDGVVDGDKCSERRAASGGLPFGAEDSDSDTFTNDEEFRRGSLPGVADPVDECDDDPCVALARRNCRDPDDRVLGDVSCQCPSGYAGDGRKLGSGCSDEDECTPQPGPCLDENSLCRNTPGSFECPCQDDFVGSGRTAGGCTLENQCDAEPCNELSVCFPKQGGFDCRACPEGFGGDVLDCAACPPGYTGNGIGAQGCGDLNECAAPGLCSANSRCINRPGGRSCESCTDEFTGDGVGANGCFKDVCAECSPFANCDPLRSPACVCNVGFSGPAGTDGGVCEDIDECARNEASCGPHSHCQNIVGGYLCPCEVDYVLHEAECVPATCDTWHQNCGATGVCDDSTGKPQCICAGLTGIYPACVGGKARGQSASALDPIGAPASNSAPGGGPVLAAESSGCSVAARSSRLSSGVSLALLVGLVVLRRARSRRVKGLSCAALWLFCAFLAGCGDPEDSSTAPLQGGGGGRTNAQAGAGGGAGSSSSVNPSGNAAGSSATGGMPGSNPTDPEPSAGASGSPPAPVMGGLPLVLTCQHSRECAADRWCNPGTQACEPRHLPDEALTFRGQIFQILQARGCPSCHSPGQRGDADPSGSSAHLLLNELQRGYLSLVAGGARCQGGAQRLCVDDPASSRLIRQVLDGQSSSPESIAFTSWSEPELQTILRWIASGAPRDGLCGNFVRDPAEACDEGPNPASRCSYGVMSCNLCNTRCQLVPSGPGPFCGDGVLDIAQETCDPTSPDAVAVGNAECGSDCTYVAR